MNLITEPYKEQVALLPKTGQHIIGHYEQDSIVVYQAFNSFISEDAVAIQRFGGKHYNYNRMSWIKPNFLWMMFRSGWGRKVNQERVLAIRLDLEGFYTILSQAVHSSFQLGIYQTQEYWQAALSNSEVRLQWDPDHDPFGNKIERRAIQLGLKGGMLKKFSNDWIMEIQDITEFVHAEKTKCDKQGLEHLSVPVERVLKLGKPGIERSIGIG